jgi:hypothetical protein
MNSTRHDTRRREHSFPLISMIQLVTLTIALVTCIDGPELLRLLGSLQGSGHYVVAAVMAAGFFGLLIGAAIGLGQIRQWRSMLFCGAVGFVTGILILAIYAAPAKPAQAITAALLPLVTTIAMRIRSA